jgi:hypothetical protein
MKLLVSIPLVLGSVFLLIGCGDRPRSGSPPQQLMEPPKTRPTPGGGNKPAATSHRWQPLGNAARQAAA